MLPASAPVTPERRNLILDAWATYKSDALRRFMAGESHVGILLYKRMSVSAMLPDLNAEVMSNAVETVVVEFTKHYPPIKARAPYWTATCDGAHLDAGPLA